MLRRWTFLLLLALTIPAGVSGCYIHHDDMEHHAFRRDDDERRGYAPSAYPQGYYAGPGYYEERR